MILGIDPGLGGALAFFDAGALEIVDMPTLQVKSKRILNEYALARLIDDRASQIREVWLEQVGVRPGEGAVGAFTFGRGYGVIRGICAASFLTIHDVTPAAWKRAMRVDGNKDEARLRASTMFPRYASLFARKRDDGRAEAALIAFYGQHHAQAEAA